MEKAIYLQGKGQSRVDKNIPAGRGQSRVENIPAGEETVKNR